MSDITLFLVGINSGCRSFSLQEFWFESFQNNVINQFDEETELSAKKDIMQDSLTK